MSASVTTDRTGAGTSAAGFEPLRSKVEPARPSRARSSQRAPAGAALVSTPLVLFRRPPATARAPCSPNGCGGAAAERLAAARRGRQRPSRPAHLSLLALGRVAARPRRARTASVAHPPLEERFCPPRRGGRRRAAVPLVLDDGHVVKGCLLEDHHCWASCRTARSSPSAPGSIPPFRWAGCAPPAGSPSFAPTDLAMGRRGPGALPPPRFTCDDETLDAVFMATEGWATGLHLALLAGEGRPPTMAPACTAIGAPSPPTSSERSSSGSRPRSRTSSCTPPSWRLSRPDLRRGHRERRRGEGLARLARENLFVAAPTTAMNGTATTTCSATCCAPSLGGVSPRAAGLHRAAAAWYEAHGDTEQAIYTGWRPAMSPRPPGRSSSPTSTSSTAASSRAPAECWMPSPTSSSEHVALTMAAGWLTAP